MALGQPKASFWRAGFESSCSAIRLNEVKLPVLDDCKRRFERNGIQLDMKNKIATQEKENGAADPHQRLLSLQEAIRKGEGKSKSKFSGREENCRKWGGTCRLKSIHPGVVHGMTQKLLA